MTQSTFAWVREDLTGPRLRELEQSKARSHAAKISHQRKKKCSDQGHRGRANEHGSSDSTSPRTSSELVLAPPPVIFKGNSDPFRTSLIEVTPRVIQAFQFLRDALVPSTHFNTSGTGGSWARRFLPDQTVRKHMESMNDEWLALAEMLPLSAALTRLSGSRELATQTLQLKRKAIRRVHSKLDSLHHDVATPDHVIRLTRTLFATATFENNMAEARMHGVALKELLYRKTKREGLEAIDVNLMWSTLYYDAQIAHTTMSTSIFDVNDWATTRLRQATEPLSQLLEPLHILVARDLDSVLKYSPTLLDTCIDIYEVTWLWQQCESLGPDIDGPMMNLYATTRHNIFQIRLSNHHARLRARIALSDVAASSSSGGANATNPHCPQATLEPHTEAAMTLALIAYLASFVGNSRIGGQYMWPRITLFMAQLHHHLTMAHDALEYNSNTGTSSSSDRLLLFAYWVGASWEHNEEFTPSSSGVPRFWFTRGFTDVVRGMRLKSWRDIKPLLDRFVPTELARPNGSSWVDVALRCADGQQQQQQQQLVASRPAPVWAMITRWHARSTAESSTTPRHSERWQARVVVA